MPASAAPLSSSDFVELVRKSQLVPEDRLQAETEELLAANKGQLPESFEDVAQHLLGKGLITEWHLGKLRDRKYKGFFLGRYRLLSHLGTGGMSSVYLAEHALMKQLRAIKVLPTHRVNDTSYLARFHLEAQSTAKLDHRNIVRAYDVAEENGRHYIVMEYVPGKDLYTVVKDGGPVPIDRAAHYIIQSAEGLQHAHEANLIHRDIKPANLLLDDRGVVKILDLGLALQFESGDASLTIAHNENVLGTADYISPEQAKHSHGVKHLTDIYSLGCTLYFLLTGKPPYPDGSVQERVSKHLDPSALPTDILKLRPDCPRDLADICSRMMQKKPERRYQTCREVAAALHTWMQRRGYDAPTLEFSKPGPFIRPTNPTPAPTPLATAKPLPRGSSPGAHDTDKGMRSEGDTAGSSKGLLNPSGAAAGSGIVKSAPPTETGSGKGSDKPVARALPVAKSLDSSAGSKPSTPALPTARAFDFSQPSNANPSGAIPAIRVQSSPTNSPDPPPKPDANSLANRLRNVPVWGWIVAGAVALTFVVILLWVLISAFASSPKPPKKPPKRPTSGKRDTSRIDRPRHATDRASRSDGA